MSRYPIARLTVAAALLALPVLAFAGGFGHSGHSGPSGAGAQYHGKHGSLFLNAPTVRRHTYHGSTRYFGRPGTVIIERRVILPGGGQWRRHGGHRFGHDRHDARSLQCGPSVCVRIR